jgi:hypothetical protein
MPSTPRKEQPAATPSLHDLSARIERARRYPRGMVDSTITALEAARPDTKEGGAVRRAVDDALDRLYRFREVETGETHGS